MSVANPATVANPLYSFVSSDIDEKGKAEDQPHLDARRSASVSSYSGSDSSSSQDRKHNQHSEENKD